MRYSIAHALYCLPRLVDGVIIRSKGSFSRVRNRIVLCILLCDTQVKCHMSDVRVVLHETNIIEQSFLSS
jgi:hypothetical protein